MLVRFRDTEGCEQQANLIWDSVFFNRPDASGGYADWIMAGATDPPDQRGGLRARMQLHTAIMIALFTDRRLPEGMTPPGDDRDPRGWWGDSIKLDGEPAVEMGSLLWTLERSTLDEQVAALARDYCIEALQPLLDQGAAARFEVETSVGQVQGLLGIAVRAFDNAGKPTGSFVYEVVWRQLITPAPMNFRDVRS